MALFRNIRQDLRQARRFNHRGLSGLRLYVAPFFHTGTIAVLTYRYGHWVHGWPLPVIRQLFMIPYYLFKFALNFAAGVNIPTEARIGPGLVVHTINGVYIPCCRIGRNAFFQHGVVVMYENKEIGDDVYFGPGAKVIRPVRIGDRAAIGANAVVLEDVPDDAVVGGIPARVLSHNRSPVWNDLVASGLESDDQAALKSSPET